MNQILRLIPFLPEHAAGLRLRPAANAVLSRPLGELGAKTYRVSGPWKDPKVEVIGREPARRQDEAGKPPQPSP